MFCQHCLAGAAGNVGVRNLSLEDWQAILGELTLIDARKVLLTGGEPLLFRDLVPLTRFIAKMGITTDLNSTLFSLTPALANALADAGLTEVSVSIDGPEDVHDHIHGQLGARRRLFDGVGLLQRCGIRVDASLCVMPTNLTSIAATIAEAANLRVSSFTVSRMLPVGHGIRSVVPAVGDAELALLHEALAGARAGQLGIPVRCVGLVGVPDRAHCQQGQSLIGIQADGSLTTCVLTRDVVVGVPRPEDVGLAAAVAHVRASYTAITPLFCYGTQS
jgi:MoaA/NifB/PqqE/SkfB family radical SAM enzyme